MTGELRDSLITEQRTMTKPYSDDVIELVFKLEIDRIPSRISKHEIGLSIIPSATREKKAKISSLLHPFRSKK